MYIVEYQPCILQTSWTNRAPGLWSQLDDENDLTRSRWVGVRSESPCFVALLSFSPRDPLDLAIETHTCLHSIYILHSRFETTCGFSNAAQPAHAGPSSNKFVSRKRSDLKQDDLRQELRPRRVNSELRHRPCNLQVPYVKEGASCLISVHY